MQKKQPESEGCSSELMMPLGWGRRYLQHLGITLTPSSDEARAWRQEAGPDRRQSRNEWLSGILHKVWMVTFRVRDLDKMVAQLRTAGVEAKIDPQSQPNGRFARLHDPEGEDLN